MNTRDTLLNQIKHGTTTKIKYNDMELQLRTPKNTDLVAYNSEDEDVKINAIVKIIIDCVKDADGKQVFEASDAAWLKEDRSLFVDFLITEIAKMRLKMIKEIEETAKN